MIYIYIYIYIYNIIYSVTQAGSNKESAVFCCRAFMARSMAAERLLTVQRKCFVSQRALAEILSIVKNEGEQHLATSRTTTKGKRERHLRMDTPYGPLWRTMTGFVMENGELLTVSYLDPVALLWAVCRDGGGFAEFLERRNNLHPRLRPSPGPFACM